MDVVEGTREKDSDWMSTLQVNDTNIIFKLDTGAQANVISETEYKKIRPRPKLHSTKVRVTRYSGAKIPVQGRCIAKVTHKGKVHTLAFIVVPMEVQAIRGLRACVRLDLVKCVLVLEKDGGTYYDGLMREYNDLFQGLGCPPGEHTIRVGKRVPPVIHPYRIVPFALEKQLKNELDRMESLGVIPKIDEPIRVGEFSHCGQKEWEAQNMP